MQWSCPFGWVIRVVSSPSLPARGVSFCEETGIRVLSQHHAAGSICDAIAGIGGNIVKQLHDFLHSSFSCIGLLGADGAKGGEQFIVKGLCIVKK